VFQYSFERRKNLKDGGHKQFRGRPRCARKPHRAPVARPRQPASRASIFFADAPPRAVMERAPAGNSFNFAWYSFEVLLSGISQAKCSPEVLIIENNIISQANISYFAGSLESYSADYYYPNLKSGERSKFSKKSVDYFRPFSRYIIHGSGSVRTTIYDQEKWNWTVGILNEVKIHFSGSIFLFFRQEALSHLFRRSTRWLGEFGLHG